MTGRFSYYIDVEHKGLGKFRRITGSDQYVVGQKAREQQYLWDEQWAKKSAAEDTRQKRANLAFDREAKKNEAAQQTLEAQCAISDIQKIIPKTLSVAQATDWTPFYDRRQFQDPPPLRPTYSVLHEPSRNEASYLPRKSLLYFVFTFVRRRRDAEAEVKYQHAHSKWAAETLAQKQGLAEHDSNLAKWQERKGAFESAQAKVNASIDALKVRHLNKEEGAIIEYTDLVLARSEYPDFFPRRWEIDFVVQTGVMIIDYELPAVNALPNLKAVRYIQTRDSIEESYLKENEIEQLYEDMIYQTCLRTIREVFSSDIINAIRSVTFNGWVDFIDKANGKPARACILSLQATKEKFDDINLEAVDPKMCFRSLKGVGSAKLAGMVPVVPILRMNRSDERFIPAQDVIDTVHLETNIAAISWEEFEHLVRDIFEKEFSANGGEVKITRTSRDHGVDAIAFDPDPIRGGKIVIQAKRYTNTVGVSAVRDLYGTVINEGASRGILVTTSVYGSDSYEFAKDKPLTLLNGGNLLHLLAKHGHPARIDLAEAKLLAEQAAADRK